MLLKHLQIVQVKKLAGNECNTLNKSPGEMGMGLRHDWSYKSIDLCGVNEPKWKHKQMSNHIHDILPTQIQACWIYIWYDKRKNTELSEQRALSF